MNASQTEVVAGHSNVPKHPKSTKNRVSSNPQGLALANALPKVLHILSLARQTQKTRAGGSVISKQDDTFPSGRGRIIKMIQFMRFVDENIV